MRNFLLTLLTATVVMFSGCASKSAAPLEKTGLEGTKVNTYLVGEYMDTKAASSKLEAAGFEIVATYAPVKKGTTIVFTNAALKAEAAKPGRAYAAVLRLFVDDKEKMISITNPVYFGKAFMQDEYNHSVFNAQLESINKAFPALKASADMWDFDGLADYHFMMGMPYYGDADKLGKASASNSDAMAKVKAHKKGKSLIFELKLSETSTLIGYDLGKRTKKFVKKVGRANAAILPWCVSIENGQASALNAKYYIAISYPLLTMTEFMGIATVPGAITKDLEKPFK
ncbi:MAG: hypothetical protein U9Q40_01620 [Campylobacterota bacterium]|nr:hypothetical protein [Campylobacterota bacterium]